MRTAVARLAPGRQVLHLILRHAAGAVERIATPSRAAAAPSSSSSSSSSFPAAAAATAGKRHHHERERDQARGDEGAKTLTVSVDFSGPLSAADTRVQPNLADQWYRELDDLRVGAPELDDEEEEERLAAAIPVPPDTPTETVIPLQLRCTAGVGEVRVSVHGLAAVITVPVRVVRSARGDDGEGARPTATAVYAPLARADFAAGAGDCGA